MPYKKRMYELRIDNDLRQEDVAKVLNTTKQNYGMYEKGKRKISVEDLIKLSKYYNVSVDYILGLTDEPEQRNAKSNNIKINQKGKVNKIGDISIK